jgi:hypothetical protein
MCVMYGVMCVMYGVMCVMYGVMRFCLLALGSASTPKKNKQKQKKIQNNFILVFYSFTFFINFNKVNYRKNLNFILCINLKLIEKNRLIFIECILNKN